MFSLKKTSTSQRFLILGLSLTCGCRSVHDKRFFTDHIGKQYRTSNNAFNLMNLLNFPALRDRLMPVGSALIINPIYAGGGDRSTGLKVRACLETMGFITQLLPIELPLEINIYELCDRAIVQTERLILDDHSRSVIKAKPLVVITPLNKSYCRPVKSILATIGRHIRLTSDRLLVINEMGYYSGEDGTALFQTFLKSTRFRHVKECTLGFDSSQEQIGYMRLPDSELAEIEHNHQTGIDKFCDSLNIDINTENSLLFFSYLSTDAPLKCALNFIRNSSIEIQAVDENHQKKAFHYVFVLRNAPEKMADRLADDLIRLQDSQFYQPGQRVRIFHLANDRLELDKSSENKPDGHSINIYLVRQTIPMSVFRYFIRLSILGAMTGDNSFSEYLSIKGSLPYYEIQIWKSRFVRGLWQLADETGIDHLRAFYQARCFGEYLPPDNKGAPEHYHAMTMIDRDDLDSCKGQKAMTEHEAVALVKQITRRKHEFEATLLAQDARKVIQAICRPVRRIRFLSRPSFEKWQDKGGH